MNIVETIKERVQSIVGNAQQKLQNINTEQTEKTTTPYQLTLVGWVILLGLLFLLNRSSFGKNIIYMALVLILITLLLGNYERILNASFKTRGDNDSQ